MSACAVCGAPLDGESRFWCRAHYIELGSFKMTVTPELMGLVRGPPRPVFRELLRDAIKRRAKTGGRQ